MAGKIAASDTRAIWREQYEQHGLTERVRMAVAGGGGGVCVCVCSETVLFVRDRNWVAVLKNVFRNCLRLWQERHNTAVLKVYKKERVVY
jgi:hypothetical protein